VFDRVWEPELMDDLSRPDAEFAAAYRELAAINRMLGGIRAVERFLPSRSNLSILDVAAGGCDVGEALTAHRVTSLDINPRGLRNARRTAPVIGDALKLPFPDRAFDVVMSSLFFHHLRWNECVLVLREMWRTTSTRLIVNDLHRHPIAYAWIRVLASMFSKSVMVKNDGPLSVRRAFKPGELGRIGNEAGVPCRVYRSFPYRIVLVADKI
jgi:ubiquinone/menaquinone biosynthesis C-methylase UbiE